MEPIAKNHITITPKLFQEGRLASRGYAYKRGIRNLILILALVFVVTGAWMLRTSGSNIPGRRIDFCVRHSGMDCLCAAKIRKQKEVSSHGQRLGQEPGTRYGILQRSLCSNRGNGENDDCLL